MEQAIWVEQRQGGGKGSKGQEGPGRGVEASGGGFLTRAGASGGGVAALQESPFTLSNNCVRRVVESSAQFCIPTSVASGTVFIHRSP